MIPFVYILYVLFVQLTKSLQEQPESVRGTLSRLRYLILGSWIVYPLAYALPMLSISGSDAWVFKQVGYSIADIVAKAVYALIIFSVARRKSFEDDPVFARQEMSPADIKTINI